jgi:aminoglycoside phosphotransferase (APT) family kinase protein
MPVPQQRDPSITRARLASWLSGRLSNATEVSVPAVDLPAARGFSTEKLLFDAVWRDGVEERRQRFVARVASGGYQLYPSSRLEEQFRLMRILALQTDVPVPEALWFEPGTGVLGAPFLVMSYVDGRVPPDFPSYHRQGWLAELRPPERAGVWWAGVDALRRVHRLDTAALGLDFIGQPNFGPAGLTQQLNYYEHHLGHFSCADAPVALTALAWLRANQPQEPDRPGLVWGDARIGNIIFGPAGGVAAVLDWEMATLGPPEMDLGWFLYLDRNLSEGIGTPRLAGLPGRAETIERYRTLSGREVTDPDYYEVFAGFRLMLITARLTELVIAHGMVPPGQDFPLGRNTTNLLAATLATQGVRL